ncbi:MAG TPA: Ig-like domain-containing protein, partial [Bryobacteraceae bacterium]|nr:Ig-like domain-containing protein [Bryobacteraceae bacterium]
TFNLTFEVTDTAGAKSTRALSLTVGSNSTTISVVSPAPNARVQGQITLSVNLQNAAAVASVEYLLNGRSISGLLTQSPYSLPWRTGSVYDSRSTLKAVARNAAGAIIATSAEVPFTIANGTVELTHVSPDPSVTASGVVTWTVTTNLPSTVGKPIFFCFLDGRMARQHFTNDRFSTISVDTTQLGNGPHEFYCTLDAEASVFRYGLAMTQVVVNVNNGRAPRELRSRWREVLLLPGETVSLSPKLVYTNGEEEATTATFSSANSAIASVDSTGVVRGNSVGTTTVTLNSQGRTDTVTVIVRSAAILPHFSKSGGFLNAYDPAKSTFVRGLISMGYSEVEQPGMSDRIKEASINTLNVGFYYNPYYERSTSFSQWRVGMDNMLNRVTEVARANDLSLYLIGDDIARQPEYLHNTLYNSWSPQALQHVLGWARDSGRVIGIDMVDEIDFMWGDTPTPTDGRWSSKTPPLGNDAFIRLMSIMNAVPGRPKLTFPASGAANNQTVRNWMANPAFSDFSSIYWHFRDWRRAYPLSGTNHQIISNVDRTVSERQPVLFQNRPTMLLTSIMGPEYVKLGPGSEFVPGQDKMLTQGTTPEQVALTALYAAATGMAGVRTYSYDQDYQNEIRKNTPPGVGQHQTGSDPNRTGTDRWQAMASAFGVIRQIEPYLLQPKMHAIDLGAQFTTGARQGPASRLLIAIHAGDAPATTWVDLSPYQYAGAQGVTCYRLLGAKLSSEVHATVPSGLTTFAPGEVIVWLFEPSTVVPAPAVRITSPLQDMIVSGTAQIHATVSSPQLSRVEFYVDGKLVSTQTGAPFRTSIDAATLSSGVWHGVTVRAWDQRGRSNDARVSFRTVQ